MLGAIIGDIVGSRFEFNNTSDFNFQLFAPACDFTDDTICTVAVADAVLNGKPIDNHLMSVLHMLSIKNRKRLDITKREDL